MQSLLFANAVIKGFDNSSWQNVFTHFKLKTYELLHYERDIEVLYKLGYLARSHQSRHDERNLRFTLPKEILKSISQNNELLIKPQVPVCLIDVLGEFDQLSDEKDDRILDHYDFLEEFDNLLEQNSRLPFIQWMKGFKLDFFEMYYLMDSIWDCLNNNSNDFVTGVDCTVKDYFESKSKIIEITQAISTGNFKLIKLGLIEISMGEFNNHLRSKITEQVVDFLKEKEELTINQANKNGANIIDADSLHYKALFYNPEEEKLINMIGKMLDPAEFDSLQMRLMKKGMPIGFCTLLYGLPGTGKTESVYQLAKATGRSIYKVDISETKSMWFGESQKLVKDIFTQYKILMKKEKLCPILLFNEADGLISKRKAVNSSNVASTENAIQNILLEEMESFEGILFATTNLIENIDNAFERRFLFKVRFDKSTVENGARIWQNKLDFLNQEEAISLASQFDFSGGEMENIARKCLMEEVLLGAKPTITSVRALCENEKWGSEKTRQGIGFRL
ncbi:ATP-binding protein [Albibacterium sp.]|uniref:ATP-binding protein n=1 Tax=Albibacterium sp. TaxID=2952885 RepID=UPI002D7F0664|nr:ATP-binding protein [Albibacterium sp.]